MSFDYLERSNHAGQPVSLYQFDIGGLTYRYAAGEDIIPYGTDDYMPLAIKDSGVNQSGSPDVVDSQVTITIDASAVPVQFYRASAPSSSMQVLVRRKHYNDSEAPVLWVGVVQSVRIIDDVTAEMICVPVTASFNRNGLRLGWQRACPHALYDHNCQVDRTAHQHAITIETLGTTQITSSGLALLDSGTLAGGYIEWTTELGLVEQRAIEIHTGSSIYLMGVVYGLSVGQVVMAYEGCDRLIATCDEKFGNMNNYGGFPHLPGKSPFDGDPIF